MTKNPEKYRRFQEMEIKHGRFSMAACVHVFLTEAGVRWPGYLSFAEDIKFSDMPGGTIASWAALPGLSWVQIVLIVALFDNSVFKQKPDGGPGDVIPCAWEPSCWPRLAWPSPASWRPSRSSLRTSRYDTSLAGAMRMLLGYIGAGYIGVQGRGGPRLCSVP